MNINKRTFAQSLRTASPYIVDYQRKTFLCIISCTKVNIKIFSQLIEDLVWLDSIGIQLIITSDHFINHSQAISNEDKIKIAQQDEVIFNTLRQKWQQHNASSNLIKGDFVSVKPRGIINGKNLGDLGEINSLQTKALANLIDDKSWVLYFSPIGFSNLGKEYVFTVSDLIKHLATTIESDKLLYLYQGEKSEIHQNLDKFTTNHLSLFEAKQTGQTNPILNLMVQACENGVNRSHAIDITQEGTLLTELFTPDGSGLLVHTDSYDSITIADESHVKGIFQLVSALEKSGYLVNRSFAEIDQNINNFWVMKRDDEVIACIALHPIENNDGKTYAEVTSLAVKTEYQNQGFAKKLLQQLEKQAKQQKINCLITLTTKAQLWFEKQGYKPSSWQKLPQSRKNQYDHDRNSLVLIKTL